MASSNGQPPSLEADAGQSLSSQTSRRDTTEGSTPPRAPSTKVVSIAEPETTSPSLRGTHEELEHHDSFDLDKAAKKFRASVSGKRLSGRPSMERLAAVGRASMAANPSLSSLLSDESEQSPKGSHHHHPHESLLQQVSAWLKHEKARRAARKAKRNAGTKSTPQQDAQVSEQPSASEVEHPRPALDRRPSDSSEGSVALEQLANILERTLSLKSIEASPRKRRPSHGHNLSSIMKRRQSTVSSDTDYFEGAEDLVPSCEAILDNSRTMAYGAGGPESSEEVSSLGKKSRKEKEKEAWATFKYEIVRLTHTLRLKGWRRVPLSQSGEIDVQRLSGALTNAVYVASPPAKLPSQEEKGSAIPAPKNPPPKLLLRIYGPQVEHLIDREAELQILRRLARKRIGPRLLGTFTNGRFEEYYHAKPLTPHDLRSPETSKNIAKRMRELHEGIDLLKEERENGPFVWRNWDKWVDRCEQVVTWLDEQVQSEKQPPIRSSADEWRQRGFVCGVEWPVFRKMIEKYRKWLEDQYGGAQKVNERLVFAHNDTQYGNILRLEPSGKSPLLLPMNEHKQLVVIDFEYANANLPGLEFANHFTEWCYNYHDPIPYKCSIGYYPQPAEQYRFIRAYLTHNPTYKARGGSASNPPTPYLGPLHQSGSTTALAATAVPTNISAFMLDSRAPPGEKYSYQDQEAQAEKETEEEARRLMAETRLWRLANSAQWAAWGIVQAHVPDMPDFDSRKEDDGDVEVDGSISQKAQLLDSATLEMRVEAQHEEQNQAKTETEAQPKAKVDTDAEQCDSNGNENASSNGDTNAENEDFFDYLGYAQERALFVWGDAIRLGLVRREELPEALRERVKIVEF